MKKFLVIFLLLTPLFIFAQPQVYLGLEFSASQTFTQVTPSLTSPDYSVSSGIVPRGFPPALSLTVWINEKWGIYSGVAIQAERNGIKESTDWRNLVSIGNTRFQSYIGIPLLARTRFPIGESDRLSWVAEAGVRFRFADQGHDARCGGGGLNYIYDDQGNLLNYEVTVYEWNSTTVSIVQPEVGVALDLKLNERFRLMGGLRYRQGITRELDHRESHWTNVAIPYKPEEFDICNGTNLTTPHAVTEFRSRNSNLSAYAGIYLSLHRKRYDPPVEAYPPKVR